MGATTPHVVIVAGAGPAGMAVASSLAKAGHETIILNRDIKFGGLAEYGIFPAKLKLRGGLKKQYWELLEQPNVHYFGNVSIGTGKDLTVEDLRGQGYAERLVEFALDDVRLTGRTVVPRCEFVRNYIASHPQYGDLLAA